MNVRFLDPARDEFLAAVEFYEDQQPGLGERFIQRVGNALETLRTTPRVGTPFGRSTRRIVLHHFPFNVIYALDDSTVLIVAIAHQHRKPGYWSDRL